MDLIILYGPPAVGKLTVATELAKGTGYKLFHNHLTADSVSAIHDFGTRAYVDTVWQVRLAHFASALKYKVKGVIFTFCYGIETIGGKRDDAFIRDVSKLVTSKGGRVFLVQLSCKRTELFRRVSGVSRKSHKKLTDAKVLKKILNTFSMEKSMKVGTSLKIDVTRKSPKMTADLIMQYAGILAKPS